MPLIRETNTELIVEISNKQIDTTTIKRKARVAMRYNPKEKYLALDIEVIPWSRAANNTYGQSLEGVFGFAAYSKTIEASKNLMIDADTEEILGTASDLVVNDATGELNPSISGKNVMYEFEYFKRFISQTGIKDLKLINWVKRLDAEGKL